MENNFFSYFIGITFLYINKLLINKTIHGIPNNLHKYDWNVIPLFLREKQGRQKRFWKNNIFIFCYLY